MSGAPPSSAGIPAPQADDDDDVAWALQTAQVQWKRGARADAIVWLRRAADSAMSIGMVERAGVLGRSAEQLTEQILAQAPEAATSDSEPSADDVDQLLGSQPGRYSAPMASIPIDVEVEEEPRRFSGGDWDTERRIASARPVPPPPVRPPPSRTGTRPIAELSNAPRRPPPPPPRAVRPPPPPRPLRPPRFARDSEPTFVTSAPPIEEMLEAEARAQKAASLAPADELANVSAPRESDLGSLSPAAQEQHEFASAEITAPFEDVASGTASATRMAVSTRRPSDRLEFGDTEIHANSRFPALAESQIPAEPAPASVSREEFDTGASSGASRPDSDATIQDMRLEQLAMLHRGASGAASRPPEAASSSFPSATPVVPADDVDAVIEGIALASVPGLQDLPEDAQRELVASARIVTLAVDEEMNDFGIALVLEGWVTIMPSIVDAACAHATQGHVVFTTGTLSEGVALRVVSGQDETSVAFWEPAALELATKDCPWVADELRTVADRFQTLAGVTMGAMGDRLDDSLRTLITDRCHVKTLLPYEVLVEKGSAMPGLHIIGGGRIETIVENADGSGEVDDELGPGDFLFAPQVLGAGPAPATARAGKSGALVLFADRMTTHELLVSVPPLLELLAG